MLKGGKLPAWLSLQLRHEARHPLPCTEHSLQRRQYTVRSHHICSASYLNSSRGRSNQLRLTCCFYLLLSMLEPIYIRSFLVTWRERKVSLGKKNVQAYLTSGRLQLFRLSFGGPRPFSAVTRTNKRLSVSRRSGIWHTLRLFLAEQRDDCLFVFRRGWLL